MIATAMPAPISHVMGVVINSASKANEIAVAIAEPPLPYHSYNSKISFKLSTTAFSFAEFSV